jgi:gluconate 2-dehydrogenase gamma chain
MSDSATRRTFLQVAGSTGAAWLLADVVLVRDALAHAIKQRTLPPPYAFEALTAAQAADLEAVAMRVIPSDDTPGAREAGVIHFIDRALTTFNANQKPVFDEGLADLNRRTRDRWPGVASFAALQPARQDELLRSIEQTPFFQSARFAVLAGMFSDPSYGGNRDYVGWALLGHVHQPAFQPPFGWYDAEANRGG